MPMQTCSLSSLRFALNHLYEPRLLHSSPLLDMLGLAGLSDGPAVLRQTLIKAIESLRPPHTISAESAVWRDYEILTQRYVQQNSQRQIADQLGLSIRHIKREQRRALEALAARLCEQTGLRIELGSEPSSVDDDTEESLDSETPPWLKAGARGAAARLDDLVPTVLALVAPMADHHGVTVRVSELASMPHVAVHPVVLRQIILSLITLALKRTTGGTLSISSRLLRSDIEIIIQREAPQSAPLASVDDDEDLSISQQLVKTSGGHLSSSVQGNMLAFSLQWPPAQVVPVLVIDDNRDAIRLMEHYAAGTRYRVLAAQDAAQALTLAQEAAPRVIILDVMMPEVDGWELLGRLKQHPQTSHIPIIACTILAQEELAMSLGVSAFLHKPVTAEDLLATLDRLLLLPAS
jgi:CheY-like chemotaxis protein